MSQLSRYLIRQILAPMFFLTSALTGIILLSQSLRMVDMIVNKGLSILTFAELTGLLLPGALALILPIALFLTVLIVFNRLSNDSELVVMYAAGFGKMALIRPTMVVSATVLAVVMALNVYFTPLAVRTFKDAIFEIRSNYASVLIQEGEFNTPVSGLTVYVRTRLPSGELEGILVHDGRDEDKAVTMLAERGALVRSPDAAPRFLLVNGNRQEVEKRSGKLSLLYFDNYTLDLDRFSEPQTERWIEPSERSLPELFNPSLDANDQRNVDRLLIEAHRRLTTPFYAVTLGLIALAGAVGGEFSRRGQGARLLATGAAGILFRLTEIGLASIATTVPALTVLLYLNVIAGAGVAIWVLFRKTQRRPDATAGMAPA